MRFSLNFIKEFTDIGVKAQDLAHTLTMSGMEVEYLEKKGDDWVFDIEVTTNRYDWLSMVGIAREICACLGKKLKITYPKAITKPTLKERKIIIEDAKDCPLYIARVIRGITVEDSPLWLHRRVGHCDINSINNIVDITNYCMLKWGNPLHAFDEDKIEGDIYIRRAKKGEAFIGIDEKERVLNKNNLVIADSKKVIALAGVMGAKNTEVDSNTKNVLLEAAVFSPITTRRSRRDAGLDTESSYRFERRVFPEYVDCASSEATKLMQELARGKFCGYKSAGKPQVLKPKPISISLSHLSDCLGMSLSSSKVKSILSSLGFAVKATSKDKLSVTAPSFRFDINREVDVFEEISRIYGYSKIEPQLPNLVRKPQEENIYEFKSKLREALTLSGLSEIITYSIENDEELNQIDKKEPIIISNPMRKQENSLRTTLATGMIKTIRYNLNRNQENLKFFEIADIYYKDKKGFQEESIVAIGGSGNREKFFYFKGVLEELFKSLGIDDFCFKQKGVDCFSNALVVKVKGNDIGFLGKLDESLKKSFDLKEDVFFAHLNIDTLMKLKTKKTYVPFSMYPAVSRDISIVLSNKKSFEDIENIIRERAAELFEKLEVVDVYKGKDIPSNASAFTLRVFYQSGQRTLTSDEVDNLHSAIRDILSKTEEIQLR